MVGVLEEDRVVGAAAHVERAVVAGVDQRPGLALLVGLRVHELDDVRVVRVQDHHLRGAPRLAAALDDAGEGVVAAHERDRSRRRAAAGQRLAGRADRGQVRARARAELEQHALGAREAEDRLHRVVDGVDEARRGLRVLLDADVEPDRAVEGRLLLHEQVRQLVAEGLQVLGRREVALRLGPAPDRVDDPRDQAAHALLAVRRAELAAEVLRRDDVRRGLAPGARDLDPVLLEDGLASLVVDHSRTQLPGDLVVGVASRLREVPPESQTRAFVRVRCGAGVWSRVLHGVSRHRRYLSSGGAVFVLLATTLR